MSHNAFSTGKTGLLFWVYWVLANAIVVGLMIALALIVNYIPHAALGWSIVGISLGIAQHLVLKNTVRPRDWAWLSAIGWIVGAAVGKISVGWQAAGWDMDWALMGLSLGVVQYFSLRKYVTQAGWWILASGLALVLAGALGGATALLEDWFMFKELIAIDKHFTEQAGFVLAGTAGGAVYGAITGVWLIWFFRVRMRQPGETD